MRPEALNPASQLKRGQSPRMGGRAVMWVERLPIVNAMNTFYIHPTRAAGLIVGGNDCDRASLPTGGPEVVPTSNVCSGCSMIKGYMRCTKTPRPGRRPLP
jgi:hypothetical protein